jgi:hypothetical protein
MARLPTVGGDDGDWGTILNDYLQVAHNTDGTLKANATRQTTATRTAATPATGILIYDTDLEQLFIGDGSTSGGVAVTLDEVHVTNLDLAAEARNSFAPTMIEPVEVYSALNTTAADSSFAELDLSSYIPVGTTLAWIECMVYGTPDAGATLFRIRSVGHTVGGGPDNDGALAISPVLSGVYSGRGSIIPIKITPSRKIEYKRENPNSNARWYRINLWGYS